MYVARPFGRNGWRRDGEKSIGGDSGVGCGRITGGRFTSGVSATDDGGATDISSESLSEVTSCTGLWRVLFRGRCPSSDKGSSMSSLPCLGPAGTDDVGVFHGWFGIIKFLADSCEEEGAKGVDGWACGGNGYLNRNGEVIFGSWLSLFKRYDRHRICHGRSQIDNCKECY